MIIGIFWFSKFLGTHLRCLIFCFADDRMFFFKDKEGECQEIRRLLQIYEITLGQLVNMNKFEVTFSKNVDNDLANSLKEVLGNHRSLESEPYLASL